MSTTTSQPSSPGSFFSLPPELRNEVYGCLANTSPIDTTSKLENLTNESTPLKPSRSALTNTCRQTYLESSTLFYTHTTFKLLTPALPAFLRAIQAPHILSIQSFILEHSVDEPQWQGILDRSNPHFLGPLAAFQGLKHLRITGLETPLCWSQQMADLTRFTDDLVEFVEPELLDDPFENVIKAMGGLKSLEVVELVSRMAESFAVELVRNGPDSDSWRWTEWKYGIEKINNEGQERGEGERDGADGNLVESILRRR